MVAVFWETVEMLVGLDRAGDRWMTAWVIDSSTHSGFSLLLVVLLHPKFSGATFYFSWLKSNGTKGPRMETENPNHMGLLRCFRQEQKTDSDPTVPTLFLFHLF